MLIGRRAGAVVGAGPVGTTASILLAQQGIRNRSSWSGARSPQRAPAAHVVNARTFEILRAAGVDAAAIGAACKDPADAGFVRWVTTLAGDELGRLPFERQGDDVLALTPTPLRNLSQHRLEPILLEHLRRQPRGHRCASRHEWQSRRAGRRRRHLARPRPRERSRRARSASR